MATARAKTLPTDTDSLQAMVKDLQALVYNKEAQVRKLQEQLNRQQDGLYGSSSEKLTPPPVRQLE